MVKQKQKLEEDNKTLSSFFIKKEMRKETWVKRILFLIFRISMMRDLKKQKTYPRLFTFFKMVLYGVAIQRVGMEMSGRAEAFERRDEIKQQIQEITKPIIQQSFEKDSLEVNPEMLLRYSNEKDLMSGVAIDKHGEFRDHRTNEKIFSHVPEELAEKFEELGSQYNGLQSILNDGELVIGEDEILDRLSEIKGLLYEATAPAIKDAYEKSSDNKQTNLGRTKCSTKTRSTNGIARVDFSTFEQEQKQIEEKSILGTCPKCKHGEVKKFNKLASCQNEECDFKIWLTLAQKKLPDTILKELIKQGKTNKKVIKEKKDRLMLL
ncbi:hypothetical protein NGC25_13600 [Enterococcus faecalis]|uniref:topoisomerase C-terminal repeat-containing protein n=1 Tax=Enterococcus faecalis TaxID=1351 RepID=UPI002DBF0411|nr:hypothetical protein [Enterococcus faecalis]MEB7428309.1 hypothetical protein [Enterococcus faecalis]